MLHAAKELCFLQLIFGYENTLLLFIIQQNSLPFSAFATENK
jgi:hypothetical protein